tara:strand:+ start:6667 stop:6879 length:213 start_codon:yes stop_codon:yes gene_type:complete
MDIKMDKHKLKEIIETYKWIKVEKFDPKNLKDVNTPMDLYNRLESHHIEETEFLIKVCRELAKELLVKFD